MSSERILIVDDEEKLLKGIERHQGDDFDIVTALGPHRALELLEEEGPFAVVVSDMRMPEMNGIELLSRIEKTHPNTVRMMLTGFAELSTTIEAINRGHIFRFLTKPCDQDDFAAALRSGLHQHALIEAEKELLEGTLRGSVNVLSEVLSLVSPLAFGQAARIRATVDGLLKRIDVPNHWQLEVASMLVPLGSVTVPDETLQLDLAGEPLSAAQRQQIAESPRLSARLISEIPRLERVSELIEAQCETVRGGNCDLGKLDRQCQVLVLAVALERKECALPSSRHALAEVQEQFTNVDDQILKALVDYVTNEKHQTTIEVALGDLEEKMVLAEDVRNANGTLLMCKGQKITTAALRLLENVASHNPIKSIKIVDSECCAASI